MTTPAPSRPVLSYAEATEIVELLRSASAFTEFRLRSGDLEIEVRRGAAPASGPAAAGAALPGAATAPVGSTAPAAPAAATTTAAAAPSAAPPASPPAGAAPVATPSAAHAHSERAVLITSPMVGTFYRSPEPGAPPFVEVGQAVEPDTTVCIIEVMKLMNTLPAGCQGVVTQIRVGDGEAVEYGQLLIVIEPR